MKQVKILVCGWKGVGKSRIIRQVVEEAKHQQLPLFDVIVGVRMPGADGPGEALQMRIRQRKEAFKGVAKAVRALEKAVEEARVARRWEMHRVVSQVLKIDLGDSQPSEVLKKTFRTLQNKRFLLTLEDVWECVNLKKIGVPAPSNGSKIVITSRSGQGVKDMVRLEEGKDEEELTKEEVRTLFRDESMDVAANLPNYSGLLTGDIVLECFYYASLFNPSEEIDVKRLIKYWRLEGFMDALFQRSPQLEEKEKEMEIKKLGNALLKELAKRCMLLVIPEDSGRPNMLEFIESHLLQESFEGSVEMETHIRDMIDCRRYWVRFDSNPKEDSTSEASEAPNLEGIERISIINDDIDRLVLLQGPESPSPNCPKLTTLFLHDNRDPSPSPVIPYSFFQFMPLLRVLRLYKLTINSLSSSISCLHNLRSLELRDCGELEALPSFSKAWENLQLLDLEGTRIKKYSRGLFRGHATPRTLGYLQCLQSNSSLV